MAEWCCSYVLDGRRYALRVTAESWEEAERHLEAIGVSGVVDGELVDEGEVWPWMTTAVGRA